MPGPRRIAIVGSGPIGLEAALYARTLGHDVVVFDGGDVAENVRRWEFVTLFSPWEMNATELGWQAINSPPRRPHPQVCPSGHELRERYLMPLAQSNLLRESIRPFTTVISIGREDFGKSEAIDKPDRASSPFRILVRDAIGAERIHHADVVLDCSGTYGHHRWSGRGGIPAPGERHLASRIVYTLPDVLERDRERFADRHTLLIGCGYSAATVLQNLSILNRAHPKTTVSWAIRRPGQALEAIENDPLPARANLVQASMRLAHDPPEWLEFLGDGTMESIALTKDGRFHVTLRRTETQMEVLADQVVALVGYSPDSSIFDQLQATALLGQASAPSIGNNLGPDTLRNPEPNFLILGAKSFGTNSGFLLRTGHAQVRDAFRLIENDPHLDLYHAATPTSPSPMTT